MGIQIVGGIVLPSASPSGARVVTTETTASTTYADLATTTDSVTITTGTTALVFFACVAFRATTGNTGLCSVAVSGASSISASDNWCGEANFAATSAPFTISKCIYMTGLTAGSNTFKMKYRVDGGAAGSFAFREIVVIPI